MNGTIIVLHKEKLFLEKVVNIGLNFLYDSILLFENIAVTPEFDEDE
jgi:hypothetical protein